MATEAKTSIYPSKVALSFALFMFGINTISNIYLLHSKEERDKMHLETNLLIPATIVSLLLLLVSVWGLFKPEIFSDKRILWLTLALFVAMYGITIAADIHAKASVGSYIFGTLVLIFWIWLFNLKKGLNPSK
jgi:hypothetical protein